MKIKYLGETFLTFDYNLLYKLCKSILYIDFLKIFIYYSNESPIKTKVDEIYIRTRECNSPFVIPKGDTHSLIYVCVCVSLFVRAIVCE